MRIILIGASTGGPNKIQKIISSLGVLKESAVIIAQHMTSEFLYSWTKELNKISKNKIYIPQNNQKIEVGIYICEKKTYQKNLTFYKEETTSFNPDINTLFNSFVDLDIPKMGVILTGIGNDGVEGCYKLYKKGAICLTETKESAIIDGMSARAREKNIPAFDFDEIVKKIVEFSK